MIEEIYTQVPTVPEEDDNTRIIIIGASAGAGGLVLLGFLALVGVGVQVSLHNSY